MKMNSALHFPWLALGLAGLLAYFPIIENSNATTLYWDGDGNATNGQTDGSGYWTTGSYWYNGTTDVAWSSYNAVVFGTSATPAGSVYTVTNSGTAYSAVQANSIVFQGNSSYILAGNAFNIQNTLTVNSGVTSAQTISASISFGMVGNSTATLSNNATSSAGTLNIVGGKILPISGTVGGRLVLNGTGTGTNLIAAAVSENGAGTVSVNVAGSAWHFTGANTYSGGTTVSAGRLNLGSATTMQNATGLLTVSGGTLSTSVASTAVGSAVVLTGGTLSLNDVNAGVLTLAVNQSFSMSNGNLLLTLGTAHDSITGSGTGIFSITGGTLLVDVSGSGFSYTDTYALFNGFSSGSVANLTIDGYDKVNYLASLSDTGVLSFASIPESSSQLMVMLGLSVLGVMRWRRFVRE